MFGIQYTLEEVSNQLLFYKNYKLERSATISQF